MGWRRVERGWSRGQGNLGRREESQIWQLLGCIAPIWAAAACLASRHRSEQMWLTSGQRDIHRLASREATATS